jgi:hypothetical protein
LQITKEDLINLREVFDITKTDRPFVKKAARKRPPPESVTDSLIRPDAPQAVQIAPAAVGLGLVPVTGQTKPFLMLLESVNPCPVIELTKTPHVSLIIVRSIREATHGLRVGYL